MSVGPFGDYLLQFRVCLSPYYLGILTSGDFAWTWIKEDSIFYSLPISYMVSVKYFWCGEINGLPIKV